MHAVFMPYGIRSSVEHTLRDMEAQKFKWKFTAADGTVVEKFIQGSVRLLPFGVYEYVFPKEFKDLVLTTLEFHKPNRYEGRGIFGIPMWVMRKFLGLKESGEFDTTNGYLWIKNDILLRQTTWFIPIGIREDEDQKVTEDGKEYTYEAL